MFSVIGNVFGFVIKNLALIVGIIEALLKVAGGIVSLTPNKKDDVAVAAVDKVFSSIKKFLYTISDKLSGKEITTPNS